MEVWQEGKLKDFADVKGGKRLPKGKKLISEKNGHPYIRIRDLGKSKILEITSDYEYVDDETQLSIARYIVDEGDILISVVGTIGLIGIVGKTLDKANQTENCDKIININGLDREYLYYYLMSPMGQEEIKKGTVGAVQPKLPLKNVQNIKVIYPSVETQRKISRILAILDRKIDINNQINRKLSEQAQAFYWSWFVSCENFGGKVPSNWRKAVLGDIAEIKTSTFKPTKEPDVVVEHYSIPALDEKHFPVFEIAESIKSNKYILTQNSVIISKLNPDTKRIWRPLCISDRPICSTEFIVFEAKNSRNKDYIYSIIDSTAFSNYLCSHVTGSTGSRQRAVPKATLDFELFIPTQEIIDEFCSFVTPLYDLIASNELENYRLAELRDSLLPKLMSGEIDVSNIKI